MTTAAQVAAQVNKTYNNTGIASMASALMGHGTHLPTGIFSLDVALHGGWPEGKCNLIFGWESSGKTLVAMRSLASAQRWYPDKTACLIDAENTYDPAWGAANGIDNDRLLLVHPPSGEVAIDTLVALLKADDVSLVVLDSLPALVPVKEQDKAMEDGVVALQALLINRAYRVVNAALMNAQLGGHRPTFLAINQWRNRIVQMGDPRVLPGGNNQRFSVVTMVEMEKPKEVMGKDARGREIVELNEHGFKIKKSKVGNGVKSGSFDLIRNPANPLGAGCVDDGKAVIRWAAQDGVLTGGAGKYRLPDLEETFRTHDMAVGWLYESPEYFDQLKVDLIGRYREGCGLPGQGWLPETSSKEKNDE